MTQPTIEEVSQQVKDFTKVTEYLGNSYEQGGEILLSYRESQVVLHALTKLEESMKDD